MFILGIDPGIRGGFAFLNIEEAKFEGVNSLPVVEVKKNRFRFDIDSFCEEISDWLPYIRLAVVEQPPVFSRGKIALSSLLRCFGEIHGALKAFKVQVEIPYPQTWKSVILEGTDRSKQSAVDYVLKNFPEVVLSETETLKGNKRRKVFYHDGMAEACCLAEYGRLLICSSTS